MEIQLIYEQAALSFCLTKETTKTQEEDLPPDVQPTMIIRLTIHDRPFPFLIIADSLLYMPPIKINTAERILVIRVIIAPITHLHHLPLPLIHTSIYPPTHSLIARSFIAPRKDSSGTPPSSDAAVSQTTAGTARGDPPAVSADCRRLPNHPSGPRRHGGGGDDS